MTQYLLTKNKGATELIYALENYIPQCITISAFSLGKRKNMSVISEHIKKGELELKLQKEWKFYKLGLEIVSIVPDKNQLFKLEYQDNRNMRLQPDCKNPNDSCMPEPAYSVFRNVVDDYLLEIFFKGKIILEEDIKKGKIQFYKLKR